ncbi:outer membrane lipoprotein carrier protein LolA [Nocardioides panacihumi]|uniref:Outer membrane lipoprotein carrier protein LolA n=1 Tax=Nocardioides panacihumi TaxID=400774 RepID=A0ABN2R4E1_9ACTN
MTLFARRPQLRWLVPLLTTVVLVSAGSLAAAISANAGDPLPERSAAQLLVDVQNARVDGLSGTVVQSAALGLPSLPGAGGDQSSSLSSLVSGSHTLRVWSAGPDRTRVALLGQLGESDVVRNGSDVWIWSSRDNSARHLTIPADAGHGPATPGETQSMTPQQAADAALAAITPTTRVSTDRTAQVAGRSAYQLVLEPRDPATLVGTVRIAIDGATHIPTRVQVFARGATKPAFEIGFTSFNPSRPSSSVFEFNPPAGAHVTNGSAGGAGDAAGSATTPRESGKAKPQVVGEGWTAVVVAKLPASASGGTNGGSEGRGLGNLDGVVRALPTVSGAWGSGHLLRGTLFSVLLTDDGRVVAGAVAPAGLYAALAAQ